MQLRVRNWSQVKSGIYESSPCPVRTRQGSHHEGPSSYIWEQWVTKFFHFNTYVRLPFNIGVNALIAIYGLGRIEQTAEFSQGTDALIIVILLPLTLLHATVFFGMLKKRRWVISLNEFLLGSEVLLVSLSAGAQNTISSKSGPPGFLIFAIFGAVLGTAAWFWPNRVYFRKRSSMFSWRIKRGDRASYPTRPLPDGFPRAHLSSGCRFGRR